MAEGRFKEQHLTSEVFVESCGAILFDLSDPEHKKVCLIHAWGKEWLLPKGRRNCGETRKDAALREVTEETGYQCHLYPVKMATRATLPNAHADVVDRPHVYDNITEPFMCTIREMRKPQRTKIIWWFIAALDNRAEKLAGEQKYVPHFLDCDKALTTLTFKGDREVLRRAMNLVQETDAAEIGPGAQDAQNPAGPLLELREETSKEADDKATDSSESLEDVDEVDDQGKGNGQLKRGSEEKTAGGEPAAQ